MKTPMRSLTLILTSLIACSMTGLTGCAQRIKVLAADKVVVPMHTGQPYTPASDGYFVPKARMLDILDRLSAKDVLE